MFIECIQSTKAQLCTGWGKWRNYAPGCDLAHEHEEGRLSRRPVALRKQSRDYYVPISGRLLLLRVYVWAPITCQVGRLFGAQGAYGINI